MEIINPFKEIRNQLGYSQVKMANKVGISKHAILRCEQGMYTEPLPSYLNWVVNHTTVTRHELLAQYEAFQVQVRESHQLLLGSFDLSPDPPVGTHPLVWLRQRFKFNPTSLSKALCLNQTVINYFEQNPINQRTVPEQLLTALKDAGYPNYDLALFEKWYRDYREFKLSQQNLSVGA